MRTLGSFGNMKKININTILSNSNHLIVENANSLISLIISKIICDHNKAHPPSFQQRHLRKNNNKKNGCPNKKKKKKFR